MQNDKYSAFDANGVPTHDQKGIELSKDAIRELKEKASRCPSPSCAGQLSQVRKVRAPKWTCDECPGQMDTSGEACDYCEYMLCSKCMVCRRAHWPLYAQLTQLEDEVGKCPDKVLGNMKEAVKKIKHLVLMYQGVEQEQGSCVQSNEKEIQKLLAAKGGEQDAYYMLNANRQLINNMDEEEQKTYLAAHRKAVCELSELVHTALAQEIKDFPLFEVQEAAYECTSITTRFCELWKIASTLHKDENQRNPTVLFTTPFSSVFTHHFEGSLPTADKTKPEWVLHYCLKVMQNHWAVMKHLVGASHPDHVFYDDFFTVVLSLLGAWLASAVSEHSEQDSFFYYTLTEAINFEEGMSSLPIPQDKGLCRHLLTPPLADLWIDIEKTKLNDVLTTSVWGEGCWLPNTPKYLLKYDEWKAGKGAVDLFLALNAVAKKLGRARLPEDVTEQFVVALFNSSLERVASCAEDATNLKLTAPSSLEECPSNLLQVIIALNSTAYLLECIGSWLVNPAFCNSDGFAVASDTLSRAQASLVKCLSGFLASPVVALRGTHVENVMRIHPLLQRARYLCTYYKTFGSGSIAKVVLAACFMSIEQHVLTYILPSTALPCFDGVVQCVVSFIEEFGGSVYSLQSASPSPAQPAQTGLFSRLYSADHDAPMSSEEAQQPCEDGSEEDWT
eukprot:TRINITY_DN14702_c0_g1_i1.p1 TRINITY_DN14702_c0_g1~~TRINITY_DN14702_c0_g1_i1.p1  ORF type:complete len:687 (+),score=185.38 TRINITY_DN14702_c0_g1_i1:44-2062(+)